MCYSENWSINLKPQVALHMGADNYNYGVGSVSEIHKIFHSWYNNASVEYAYVYAYVYA